MAKIACTHPGKLGDALYTLPTIRALCARHNATADFYTSEYCLPLKHLFEYQSCIDRVIVPENYQIDNFSCGGQPWKMPVPAGYKAVCHLGFRSTPTKSLPDYIAESVGLSTGLPITYELKENSHIKKPYIVSAPRGVTSYSDFFRDLARLSPIPVVEIGAQNESTGFADFDETGRDMLATAAIIADSSGFVGLMSSMLALANGFSITKVSPHDGKSWDMRHVVSSPLNHYPINPSAEEALRLLGIEVPMTYCKTLDPADYNRFSETQHAVNIYNLLGSVQNRFEHRHRAWEYGIVLNALRAHNCKTVLDVGGGGSVFAPAAAWVDMKVVQVDTGDCSQWVADQAKAIGQELIYHQENFMDYPTSKKFDAVTCISVLEHIPDDSIFFMKLLEHVKPGGLLAMTVDFWPDGQQKVGGHLRTYNESKLLDLVNLAKDFEMLGRHDYGRNIAEHVNNYTFASLVLKRNS